MHAVIRTGGKQYRVTAGDILEVEKLDGNVGDNLELDDVLLVSNGDMVKIGQPTVEGVTVQARITGQHRAKKILVFRYRPKKRIRVRRGHRQHLTRLEIDGITVDGVAYDSPPVAAVVEEPVVEEPAVEETAVEQPVIEESTAEEVVVEETVAEVADEIEDAAEEAVETSIDEAAEEMPTEDSAESTDESSEEK